MADGDADEAARCPFLLENDDSKVVTCMCNYYSLGQAEIARGLLHIIAARNLNRALQIVRTIIWHGPPKHWLCSAFVPSSAHLAWLCLIDFQEIIETHQQKQALIPPWLRRRLEFDVLIAQALLDGAAIHAQVLTAEVASELRAYHAGLLCATDNQGRSGDSSSSSATAAPASFKLPALSLLQVTNQVSPYVNFLPSHTTDRQEQLEHFGSGGASLTKAAVQQLYDLCKSQPLLGRCISSALAPQNHVVAATTAHRLQQMFLGLTADALLQSLKEDAWRYLKFLDLNDAASIPQPLVELLSILLIVVVSDVRPTPALHARLQTLVSMATSTVSVAGGGVGSVTGNLNADPTGAPALEGVERSGVGSGVGGAAGAGNGFGNNGAASPGGAVSAGAADGTNRNSSPTALTAGAHLLASRALAEIFAQAMPPDGGSVVKPWENLQSFRVVSSASAEARGTTSGAASRSSSVLTSRFLNQIRGDHSFSGDAVETRQQQQQYGQLELEAGAARKSKHTKGDTMDGWETEGILQAARTVFSHRTKIYEAFLTHESGGAHTALRLFSVLEDGYLRLKSAQSPMPPAFELLQPSDPDALLFKVPPITFWDAYFEFTRVAGAHCLEYVVTTAVNFIQQRDFCASAWLLSPFPQLKPLVVLLCWPDFSGDVRSRQSLLDTLWNSYTAETKQDPTKTGDLLVDYWVEVLYYRLSVSWWIARLIVDRDDGLSSDAAERSDVHRARPGATSTSAPGGGTRGGSGLSAGASDKRSDGREHVGGDADLQTASSLSQVAAEVLSQVTSHSILYVMRPNLPMVQSSTLLSALQSLPPLRQAMAALEHSYDLDLTRCYYTVRCAMFIVERCVHAQGSKVISYDSLSPGRQVLEDGMRELDRLISSIERTPMQVSVFLLISSLCFMRRRHLKSERKAPRVAFGAASDFLVPPSVLLSLLCLLQNHLRPLAARTGAGIAHGAPPTPPPTPRQEPKVARPVEGDDAQLMDIIGRLYRFTQETIWRIFIGLKDFFTYSRLASLEGSSTVRPAQRMGSLPIAEEAAVEWAQAVGAVVLGGFALDDFFSEMKAAGGQWRTVLDSDSDGPPELAEGLAGTAPTSDHPFLQFCTPMEVPLSLQPATFLPRMLSSPVTLLHRSLKMNDYLLSRQVLQHFPDLCGGAIESTVRIAERFKDLRHRLIGTNLPVDAEAVLDDECLEQQLGASFETDLQALVATNRCQEEPVVLGEGPREAIEEVALLLSLSGPLLTFYVLVDLAVSAAPFSQMSTHLLKKASPCLASDDMPRTADSTLLPISGPLRGFLENWIAKFNVLVEVQPAFKGKASLASIILGIETLPSEPALLKSHLNRMHTQRHAIMSLVESVDLVKKGQTSASQRTLTDFLSSAIKSLTKEEEDSSKAVTDGEVHLDAEQMAEGLGASRYLLRFLEYLAKVADLMRSASMEAQARKSTKKTQEIKVRGPKKEEVVVDIGDNALASSERPGAEVGEGDEEVTKLFDVLAESPKGIVARLLFELGGHKQALALSEVMNVDLVEVIVNSSWVLPAWSPLPGKSGRRKSDLDIAKGSHYPMSMEVVHYLAQHESPLPQVRSADAPLLATMACLERRGSCWPSWKMLGFAREQSKNRFPSLHRWVEERCHALQSIQWAHDRTRMKPARSAGASDATMSRKSKSGSQAQGQKKANEFDVELDTEAEAEPEVESEAQVDAEQEGKPDLDTDAIEIEDEDEEVASRDVAEGKDGVTDTFGTKDDGAKSLDLLPAGGYVIATARGYTEEELQKLGVEDQRALEAIGDDHEAGMSAAYTKLVHALIAEQRYEEALQVADEYLPFDSPLTDQVLHLYLNSPQTADQRLEPTPFATHAELLDHECMYRLKKHTLAARLTLERYKRWDVDTAVQTLSMCLQRVELQHADSGSEVHSLKLELKRILEKMVTFEKILQVSGGRWQVWQEIEDMDEGQVGDAVAHLLSLQQHDLARTLTQMYGMTDPLHSLELSRLHYLFTKKNDKTSAVNRLQEVPPEQAVSFALQLLDMFDLIHHRVLLCSMLLTRLHSWLSAEQDQHLRVLHASLQLLSRVSETMQPHFLRVLKKPVLIVESLLMNARVDLLEPFLADFPEYRHDELILRYARKALALSPNPPRDDDATMLGGLASGETQQDNIEDDLLDSNSLEVEDCRTAFDGADCEGTGLGGRWCLTGSPAEDKRIRQEHVFEAAPSIGLSEQILELCSDRPQNASSCFSICNELSMRLHDLMPKYQVVGPGVIFSGGDPPCTKGFSGAGRLPLTANEGDTDNDSEESTSCMGMQPVSHTFSLACPAPTQPSQEHGSPLSSVRLVTFLIKRLLTYLQQKFRGAGPEIQAQLERSLRNLDFVPLIWQVSGHKVGLSQLCNREKAAELRDKLIAEDHLELALELCERCGGQRKVGGEASAATQSSEATWHISADPVREAKTVALQKLRRYSEARQEFSQTESTAPQAAEKALVSFESAMRYPPLLDLAALEHLQSIYTSNSLQRKLYRTTAPLSPLPTFLFPAGRGTSDNGVTNSMDANSGSAAKVPLPPVPVIPVGHPIDGSVLRKVNGESLSGVLRGGSASTGSPGDSATTGVSSQEHNERLLRVLEDRLRNSVLEAKQRQRRRNVSMGGCDISESDEIFGARGSSPVSSGGTTVPPVASSGRSSDAESAGGSLGVSASRETSQNANAFGAAEAETLFLNGVTYLCPPVHPAEMPSWSALQSLPRSGKTGSKGGSHHPLSTKEAIAGALALCTSEGLPLEEAGGLVTGGLVSGVHGHVAPRPPPLQQEDKDGRAPEEATVTGETEVDADMNHDEEADQLRDDLPDVDYEKLMLDMTTISFACTALINLRSQSNLWPDDNDTHSLLTASPMAFPCAAPLVLFKVEQQQLNNVGFNELLHFQENYGTAESLLSMLVREGHLAKACYYIFNEKVSKRLFVDVVAHHCLAHDQFHELQKVILDFDPSLRRVQEYLNVLKDFLRDRRALDLLYSYQVFTKDFVNAGLLAIQLFIASKTWDARVGHLQNAHAHLGVAHKQLFGKRRGGHHPEHAKGDAPGTDGVADRSALASGADSAAHGAAGETILDYTNDLEITEADIRRNLETVNIQMAICEAMPTEMPANLDLFCNPASQCEVAERLLVAAHFDLAQRVIDFLDLPTVELCVRASNQIATVEARSPTGSIVPVVRFLESVPKLPPVEWDSLVSNVVNIWIIEKAELRADPSAAGQLIRFIHDERCRMDAHVLTGNLTSAFQIAQRLGNLQDVLHIRSCAQKVGDQELLKHINSFLAYTSPGQEYLKKTLAL